jgi:hypothetical protein
MSLLFVIAKISFKFENTWFRKETGKHFVRVHCCELGFLNKTGMRGQDGDRDGVTRRVVRVMTGD